MASFAKQEDSAVDSELLTQLGGCSLNEDDGMKGSLFPAGEFTLLLTVDDLNQFKEAISGQKLVAFDAEGVDLSRAGKVTLISIGVLVEGGVHVFLIDTIHEDLKLRDELLLLAKSLLEDPDVIKIVHDCRQDSDALYRALTPPISLTSVFDTQVWSMKLSRTTGRDNLNNALTKFNCGVTNAARTSHSDMKSMYAADYAVWQRRPLTPALTRYASQDVCHLFNLREKILERVMAIMPGELDRIAAASNDAVDDFRSLECVGFASVPASKRGLVIGKGGSTIASIEASSGAIMCCPFALDSWLILSDDESKIKKAQALVHNKVSASRFY